MNDKVIITGTGIVLDKGSASTNRLLEMCYAFRASDIEPVLLPLSIQANVSQIGTLNGIKYRYLDYKTWIIHHKWLSKIYRRFYYLFVLIKINNYVTNGGIKFIFSGTTNILSIIWLSYIAHKNGITFIYDFVEDPWATIRSRKLSELSISQIIDTTINLFKLPFLYFVAIKKPTVVTVITHTLLKRIERRRPGKKTIVIPIIKYIHETSKHTLVSTEPIPDIRPIRPANNNMFLVHTGSTYFSKDGILEMLHSMKLVSREYPHIALLLIGFITPTQKMKIQKLIIELDIERNIDVIGEVEKGILKKYQREALLCLSLKPLNPQNIYNFSTKLIDYMESGTPILMTDLPEYGYYFENKVNCIITKPSSEDIAKNIIWAIKNKDKLLEIGQNGHNLLYTSFNAKMNIKQLIGNK